MASQSYYESITQRISPRRRKEKEEKKRKKNKKKHEDQEIEVLAFEIPSNGYNNTSMRST